MFLQIRKQFQRVYKLAQGHPGNTWSSPDDPAPEPSREREAASLREAYPEAF